MPNRVTEAQVRALTLAKQSLAPRARGSDVLSLVREIGPLRARPAVTPYIALWARLRAFDREDLYAALYSERSLVRLPAMHSDLYVVPTEDMPAYFWVTQSLAERNISSYLAYLVSNATSNDCQQPVNLDEIVPRVLEVISTRGACTAEELARWLPVLDRQFTYGKNGVSGPGTFRLGTKLLPALCAQGLLVYAEPRGSWKSDRDRYAALSTWLPEMDLRAIGPRQALEQVLLDYVSAYGPVTIGDMIHWLGTARRRQVVYALMRLGSRLARVEVLGTQGEAYVLREDLDRLASLPPPERFVRLLPPRDGALMAYRDPRRFLPYEYRERVYDWAGDSLGVVLIDGLVRGLWWQQSRGGARGEPRPRGDRITVRFFEKVDPEAMAMAGEEARALGEFLQGDPVDVVIALDGEEPNGDEELPMPIPLGALPSF
jgi:hypothetical protein